MIISNDENLQHILQETVFLISASKDIDEYDFEHNEMLKKIFLKSLENLDHHIKKYTEVTATILQTVGVKEYDGMVVAVINRV